MYQKQKDCENCCHAIACRYPGSGFQKRHCTKTWHEAIPEPDKPCKWFEPRCGVVMRE